ncbi:recQ4 helicase isoform X2 [Tachypleus tridentatus]|uniref:recQ4 helicase isoform X2 n=1 Tax=Tachypleus tridentatus TaxID=6853 RepID=UPI003FD08331
MSSSEITELKIKIKKWEESFYRENKRKPEKNDIKDASKDIQDNYKLYWKLRNAVKVSEKQDDHVWNSSLNKSANRAISSEAAAKKSAVVHFANKLKQNFEINKSRVPISEIKRLTLPKNEVEKTPVHEKEMDQPGNTSSFKPSPKKCKEVKLENLEVFSFGHKSKELNGKSMIKQFSVARKTGVRLTSMKSISFALSGQNGLKCGPKRNIDIAWLERCSTTNTQPLYEEEINENTAEYSTVKCLEKPKILESSVYFEESHKKTKELSDIALTTQVSSSVSPETKSDVENNVCATKQFSTHVAEENLCIKDNSSISNQLNSTLDDNKINFENHAYVFKELSSTSVTEDTREDVNENITENKLILNKGIRHLKAEGSACQLRKEKHFQANKRKCTSDFDENITKKIRNSSSHSDPLLRNIQQCIKESERSKKLVSEQKVDIEKVSVKNSFNSSDSGRYSISRTPVFKDNFVKINLKKKRFSRGHRHLSSQKYKRMKWKNLQQYKNDGDDENKLTTKRKKTSGCFKCGQIGHWARYCTGVKGNTLLPSENNDELEDQPLPTLEEAAQMCKGIKDPLIRGVTRVYPGEEQDITKNSVAESVIEDEELSFALSIHPDPARPAVEPLFSPALDETPPLVYEGLKKMGYDSFRPGQEKTIIRILCGLSTLVVQSTGSGKSLCYQLPAYLYAKERKCITLVVSPLVALMEDQVSGLPACLKAVCLHSGMSDSQRQQASQAVSDGSAHILLISPEAIVSAGFSGSNILPQNLPSVAFACIDEAHCLSEWSHNFRPSYLQLTKILMQKLGVRCILGLTATANRSTAWSIAETLGLSNHDEAIIGTTSLPENLILSVSKDSQKDEALINLLRGKRFEFCESVIVYCTRREDTERLAVLIRTSLQDVQLGSSQPQAGIRKGKIRAPRELLAWDAEAYHAGLTAAKRRSVQNKFMKGKLRVIVATVAFGMGLDKSNVRGIIHYNIPKSFENYVQEIGRAGRDGVTSHCHLFLDPQGHDLHELRRHIHANGVDRGTVRKLLQKVFLPCKCCIKDIECKNDKAEKEGKNDGCQTKHCPGHEVAFPVETTVQELDLKEENISTLLCYLELHPDKRFQLLHPVYATCTIHCYGGPSQLRALAQRSPPVAAALALQYRKSQNKSAQLQFPVVQVASRMGWDSGLVKKSLKQLEWDNSHLKSGGNCKRTGVLVEFSDLAFHVYAPGDLTDDEQDSMLDYLHGRVVLHEKQELLKLEKIYNVFHSVSYNHHTKCSDSCDDEKSQKLKTILKKYFESNESENLSIEDTEQCKMIEKVPENEICCDIQAFINIHHDENFTGRAIARIFHGISSPHYPAEVWGRVKFWRRYLNVDFHLIQQLASKELLRMKNL